MNGKCGFPEKQWYRTRDGARRGAQHIRTEVEARGGIYTTLHPYRCQNHWHLSHYRQGKAVCPVCNQIRPAWFSGTMWIVAAHNDCQANDMDRMMNHCGTTDANQLGDAAARDESVC